jgi:soluble lytic murein transglycosylase-like protein
MMAVLRVLCASAVKITAAVLLTASPSLAAESVLLTTGFVLRADRHEVEGATIRLYTNGRITEFPAALVAAIEPDPQPAVAPLPPAPAAPSPKQLIEQAAARYDLPAPFLHSVAKAESGYRREAVSPKGAVGLMQLMPSTAQELGADPHDPQQNVDAGARYLRDLLLKYQNDPYQLRLALAAYNAGPGAVDRHNGIPPYPETIHYIQKVLRQYRPSP